MTTFASNATWIDLAIVLAYLACIMLIGAHFHRRQKNLEEYFLAGRSMSWLPVGLSLMGAIHSGIHYIQGPSQTIRFGIVFLVGTSSWLIVYPWASRIIIPFYRRLGTFTCYEYLEERFGIAVRSLAACIFLMWRLGWIASALYVPSLAAHAVSGGRVPIVPMIIVLGVVVSFSTMFGGMRGVIWTDVLQFAVMVGGLALTLVLIFWKLPSVSDIFSTAGAAGKLDLFASIPPASQISLAAKTKYLLSSPVSYIGIPIAMCVGRLANYGTDQVMVQRFQTTKSLEDSKRALSINAVSDVIWMMILAFVGISLFTYFTIVMPLPGAMHKRADLIFPYFMSQVFPTGALGFVIATIFAASLATIGSAINSCSSVAIIDLYQRIARKRNTPTMQDNALTKKNGAGNQSLVASRILILVFGGIGTIIATKLSSLGDLIEITNKAIQTFTGPLLGLYLLGMFTRRSHQIGVFVGGSAGTIIALLVAFYWTSMGFIWANVYGLLTALLVGYLFSVATPGLRRRNTDDEPTWRRVMQRSAREPEHVEV
ncbi:MAG TPA: sodium/solute symporter [Bryobacteraceae bacterium]|nr:sodium/solute symporter [Bryobacteraceae bacterium]